MPTLKFDTSVNLATMSAFVAVLLGGVITWTQTVGTQEQNTTKIAEVSILHRLDREKLALSIDVLENAQTALAISLGKLEANQENIIRLLESSNKFGEP